MLLPFSIAILAGGQSRRMGQNKALIELGGMPVLQRVIETVKDLSVDLFLVTSTPQIYSSFGLAMVPDLIPGKAALGGIYTAINHAENEWVLVLACDMPLLNPRVITFLAKQRHGVDVVVPLVNSQPETLHAFYKKSCLPAIKKLIGAGRLKIVDFFDQVQVNYIAREELQTIDPGLNFSINLNTPEDLKEIQKLIG